MFFLNFGTHKECVQWPAGAKFNVRQSRQVIVWHYDIMWSVTFHCHLIEPGPILAYHRIYMHTGVYVGRTYLGHNSSMTKFIESLSNVYVCYAHLKKINICQYIFKILLINVCVCMFVCISIMSRIVHPINFACGWSVAVDPWECSVPFGTIWTCHTFSINRLWIKYSEAGVHSVGRDLRLL